MNISKGCTQCQKKDNPLQACSGCQRVTYCSVECQKLDWKAHRPACKSYGKSWKNHDNRTNIVNYNTFVDSKKTEWGTEAILTLSVN